MKMAAVYSSGMFVTIRVHDVAFKEVAIVDVAADNFT
jgi:hypothetical protein